MTRGVFRWVMLSPCKISMLDGTRNSVGSPAYCFADVNNSKCSNRRYLHASFDRPGAQSKSWMKGSFCFGLEYCIHDLFHWHRWDGI